MAYVQDLLVVGVGMNRCHKTAFNTEILQQHLGKRSQAVGGAGSVRDDMMFGLIVFFFVNTHYDGDIFIFAGSGDDNFLGAIINMGLSFFGILELTGAFQHNIRTIFAPGDLGYICFANYRNFFTVNYKESVFPGNIFLHSPMNGIVF